MPKSHSDDLARFDSHLRDVMRVNGKTVEQVMQDTGLGRATIFRYMKPRPSLDAAVCKKLLLYFDLSDITELFSLHLR